MKIITVVTAVAFVSYASLLRADEGTVDALNPVEKFHQLCLSEYKTKLLHDENLGLEREDELFEKYKKLTETRITLGAQLGIHFCPPEMIGHLKQASERSQKTYMANIMKAFDAKCRSEARAAVLCARTKEARQKSSDEMAGKELLGKERSLCLDHLQAIKERRKFAAGHMIYRPCDMELMNEARKSEENGAIESPKEKSSIGSKIRNMFSCFGPQGTMVCERR